MSWKYRIQLSGIATGFTTKRIANTFVQKSLFSEKKIKEIVISSSYRESSYFRLLQNFRFSFPKNKLSMHHLFI